VNFTHLRLLVADTPAEGSTVKVIAPPKNKEPIYMADLIRKRLTGKEEGFTLIELLVVIVILGILMAIAVPSYMGFRDRASRTAAQADVRAAIPSVEAYYSDHGTYAADGGSTFDVAGIKLIDQGLSPAVKISGLNAGAGYCISATVGGWVAFIHGPGSSIATPTKTPANEC
jgi:prepilin-type N-terminal cleavage/methylation domain-containing protein